MHGVAEAHGAREAKAIDGEQRQRRALEDAKLVLMAGKPGEAEAALRSAGVDQFLSAGADAVAVLKGLQERIGSCVT